MEKIDPTDRKILRILQLDAARTVTEISDEVGLSHNACWRRMKRLQETGIIQCHVALIDREKVGLPVTVFVFIRTSQHDDQWLRNFSQGVENMREVVEFHRLSGDTDYILKMHVEDIEGYDRAYKRLIKIAPLSDVKSSFSMEEIKWTTSIAL